ncbi:MAG: NADH dehydrogenase subunit 2, partial [Bacteroidetes bacterium 38_7]
MVIEQSLEEISYYQEFSNERVNVSGGLSKYLINLPIGIKQIVLTLYSQFHPFPPFSPLLSASTFSQFYMSILVFIYSVWWAFIFFPLLIYLFFKGALKKIKLEFRLLFIIALIFIMVNTAHIDVRRMMPVYPILYLIYLIIKKYIITQSYYKNVNYLIAFVFLFAISFYLILI